MHEPSTAQRFAESTGPRQGWRKINRRSALVGKQWPPPGRALRSARFFLKNRMRVPGSITSPVGEGREYPFRLKAPAV
jgi:hypothetical protein